MEIVQNGIIVNGAISLDHPLPLADGCHVVVRVATAATEIPEIMPPSSDEFSSHPFFGQWADRKDIVDSSDYVRQERDKWQQRATRQD
jgi:hypothetical protein